MKNKAVCSLLVAMCIAGSAHAKPEPSHSKDEFKTLLAGKVYIAEALGMKEAENLSGLIYFSPDGRNSQCYYEWNKNKNGKKTWKWGSYPLERKTGLWRLTKPFFSSGVLLTTNDNRTRSIPIYHEDTNILERWTNVGQQWDMWFRGHLQDSWPAWALEKCPTLDVPADLKINEDQKTPDYRQNYEAVMGKPLAELSKNKPVWLTVPTQADGSEVTPDAAVAKLEETGGRMLPVSEGLWFTYNPENQTVWLSNDETDVAKSGKLEIIDNSLVIEWDDDSSKEDVLLYDAWTVANAKPDGTHHARAFLNWLLSGRYSLPKYSVEHSPEGSVTFYYKNGKHRTYQWEMKGTTYVTYKRENTPHVVIDYRKAIAALGQTYPGNAPQ